MKLLSRFFVTFLMGLMVSATATANEMAQVEPEEVGLSSERLARFSAAMNEGVEAGHFPGVVAAVARNGKVAFFESYGYRDREAGIEMTDDSIFRIASMTKAITGVAVMILYEEGHFTLHAPVSNFIPSFKNARVAVAVEPAAGKGEGKKSDNKKEWPREELDKWLKENWDTLSKQEQADWIAWYSGKGKGGSAGKDVETAEADRPITIRDLLRHTSGVAYGGKNIWEPGDDLEVLIDKLAANPLNFQPGTRYEYGLSTDVAARLVEVVSGQSFDVFIKERILDPLDMKDTGYWVPEENANRLVKMVEEYSGDDADTKNSMTATYLEPPAIIMGGTGLVSTTRDYLRFVQMLVNNGELDGVRILGRKTVELMHANHMKDVANAASGSKKAGDKDFQFGLTFGIKGEPGNRGEFGSTGQYFWGGAYGTTFWIDPQENLVGVFMVNGFDDDISYDGVGIYYTQMLEHFTYQAIID